MKYLLILTMLWFCGCDSSKVRDETAVVDNKGSLLIKINTEAASFVIYKLQYEGKEYIIVSSVNGHSITQIK